jgi:AraC-like DNA-binding protein
MSTTQAGVAAGPLVAIAVHATRDRARALARSAFPRRRCRLVLAKTAADLERAFRETLIDAALVDVHAPNEDTWRAVSLAQEFPSAPFFALTPLRPTDAAIAGRCAAADVADLVTEGVDDGVLRDLVLPRTFTARFSDALQDPPPTLGLAGKVHLDTWRILIASGGRPVRTDAVAVALGVTREHLSRAFSAGGAANLKRIIDLVRLLAAAELSKNPGYDVADVARVLEYASSSHLSTTSQRIAGTRPASLARLRGVDLVERFVRGRMRSRTR